MLCKQILTYLIFCSTIVSAQPVHNTSAQPANNKILPGAYQIHQYLPLLKGKRVGIFANQTSVICHTHLVDTLKTLGVNIVKLFSPEHGFRGNADAGENIGSAVDAQTGIPIVSLYGKKNKPNAEDLADVDILLFDIQDVGARFYTYISSLQYFLESAIQNDKPLIILDRPNPNGFYVDGPVLERDYKSFIGMQPIPVVYGMTEGEYAKMILGEQWLAWNFTRKEDKHLSLGELIGVEVEDKNFKLTVIKCANYTHKSKYILPVKPSPNLPDMKSIYHYPSTCFFEGTVLSEGRGTNEPFCIFGHPSLPDTLFAFTPKTNAGNKEPKWKDSVCYGWNISDIKTSGKIDLSWLIKAYQLFPEKDKFFIIPKSEDTLDYFFNKLAGNKVLMQQIIGNKTEQEIRAGWQPQLQAFKKIRKKYLLYEDFE
jgi:uncharacterized protein YbbC (DUF1343 family)